MGKKTREKTVSPAESFLQFQNEAKRKEIENFEKEAGELESNTQKLVELRDKLRAEQQRRFTVLHKKGRLQEKELKQKELASEGQVEQAVQQNLELTHIQEEELAQLHRKLTSGHARLVEMQMEQQTWQRYQNMGSAEHQQQIQNLLSELDSMQKNFQAMFENIECILKASICKIDEMASELMEREKHLAFERALKQTDKNSVQKILKNDWLKKQLAIYHEEVLILDAAVSNLKKESLELTKQPCEHQLSNVQISSNTRSCVDAHAMPLHPLPCDPGDLNTLTDLGMIQEQDGALTTKIIRNRFPLVKKKKLDKQDMSSALLQNMSKPQASSTISEEQ